MTAPPPAPIRFVLVATSHPGNIGAVARAMKNMGLDDLVLVRPRMFPHEEATARASGADDVLARARVVDTVADAVADCGLIAATTARERDQNTPVMDVRDAAARLVTEAQRGPVGVLFGNERYGLSNEEIAGAHLLMRIPANPAYASLNIAMAAQLIGYELYRARGAQVLAPPNPVPLATGDEMAQLFAHWEQVMNEVDFRDRTASGTHLMNRVRRFLLRAELDRNEANILRGFLTSIQGRRRPAGPR
jgi:TrmH family RNA methyltransferase